MDNVSQQVYFDKSGRCFLTLVFEDGRKYNSPFTKWLSQDEINSYIEKHDLKIRHEKIDKILNEKSIRSK